MAQHETWNTTVIFIVLRYIIFVLGSCINFSITALHGNHLYIREPKLMKELQL